MNRFLTLGIMALLCLAISPARDKVVLVPKGCVVVDRFYKPCHPSRLGGYDCQVHVSVKHDPDCQRYDGREVLQVPK